MEKGKHNTDRIAAIFVFVFSAVFMWQLKYVHSPLDVIFPRTILIGMIVLSIILFVKSFVRPDPKSVKDLFEIKNRGKVITGVLGTFLWLLLIPVIGFAITSTTALMTLSIALGNRSDRTPKKFISTAVVAVMVVGILCYFFSTFMEVQLPQGLLF
jgi:amino acid permease